MIGIILAAGNGTRLKESLKEDCCKALKKVNGTHLIEFALNNLIEVEVDKAVLVVGKEQDLIKSIIDNEYKGLKITYVYQVEQLGLVNALIQALDYAESDDIVLQLADEIFIGFRAEYIKTLLKSIDCAFYCGVTYESDCEKIKANYSVETDEAMFVKSSTEKPDKVTNNLKGTGFCIFNKSAISLLKQKYNYEENIPNNLCDFMNLLTDNKMKGKAFHLAEKEFNINTADDLREATKFLS